MRNTIDDFGRIEPNTKTTLRKIVFLLAASLLLASCASVSPVILHDTVGPALALANQEQNGSLRVYTATAWMSDGDGPLVLGYTNYKIEAGDDSLVQPVSNGGDEPARVSLPKGIYVVEAESESSGTVRVPVLIETDKTTEIYLEREKDWKPLGIPSADLVRLPNGQAIGFRARGNELLKGSTVAVAQSKNRREIQSIPNDRLTNTFNK